MSVPVILNDDAQQEFDEAFDWYDARSAAKAAHFASSVRGVLRRIATNPRFYGLAVLDIRKAVVKSFPFCVYYYEESHRVVVVSVFHTSRDPAIWQGRR